MESQGYKLGYWACRGLAQRIRLLLQYTATPYTQQIYNGPEGRDKWFNTDKPKIMERNLACNLPYLQDGDTYVFEANAICSFICLKANKPELLGKDLEEKTRYATINAIFRELYAIYIKLVYGKYNEPTAFQEAMENLKIDTQPFFKKLHGLLGDKEFFIGGVTCVDFGIADMIQALEMLNGELLKPYPNLVKHQERIWALPELKDYFSSDRFKEKPCNNYTAFWK